MSSAPATQGQSDANAELFARAQRSIPGGVNSPVRAFRSVGGTPRFIRRGEGAYFWDAAGHRYVDLICSWGPMIAGHGHPAVLDAIARAARDGLSFGAPTEAEVAFAERIIRMVPAMEQVRLVSSGTEATMSAIRLARAFTERDLIVKFSGCYHGHADHLLVAAGSGLATFGQPSSAGVPEPFTACTRVLPLDEETALEALFAREGGRIAAVIIEPVPANHGLLPQRREFLLRLREITRRHGALLIFDEVISGFRLARGGAAEQLGLTPDLATFGKVIGGGLPVGAFAGPRHILSRLAPDGDTYQAGTLSGNPVAMASGTATLDVLIREDGWKRLEALGAQLEQALRPVLGRASFPVHLVRVGSLFWLSLHEAGAPRTAEPLPQEAVRRFGRVFHALLSEGIYFPPSAYEACFLSLAHTAADFERLAASLGRALAAS